MESMEITILSKKVLQEIGKTAWSKKYRDHLRCKGIKAILQYFSSRNIVYYSETVLYEFELISHSNYESGNCSKATWNAIHRCSAFLKQAAVDGHISTEPLRCWSTEIISLFWQPTQGYIPDKNLIQDLVYLTKQAMLNADLSEKTKRNYTYDGFADVLRHFLAYDTSRYSEKMLDQLSESTYDKYANREIDYVKCKNILKIVAWIKEYYATDAITQKKLLPRSFKYAGDSYEKLLCQYAEYAASHTVLKPSSINSYTLAARRFFRLLEQNGVKHYSAVTLQDITHCIVKEAKKHPRGIENTLDALRSFSAFVLDIHPELPDISKAITGSPAKHRKVFEGYTKDESEKILASIDKSTAIGNRDYAILLLAYNTGLRGVDIAKLTFDNIDWDKCEIQLVQEKTGVPIALPLNFSTGRALMNYILNWRGQIQSEYIFLRMSRPFTKLKAGSMTTVVSKYAIPVLGKDTGKKHGPHAFRRGIGARMLDAGVAASVMSDVLGHS